MGLTIGGYRAVEHLGGGRSEPSGPRVRPFWRAEDARTLEDVGLAVLPVEAADIVREAVDAAVGVRHPHLLPVADVVEDGTRLAVVAAWPRGGRLTELVRRRGVLTVGETVTVLLPIAAALAAVHGAGLRHGWVCPESIWFDTRGRPLLGPAAIGPAVAAVAGPATLGCADIAPEIVRPARSAPPGAAADVFSLGSVALFALTGRSAWPADEPADVLVQSAAGQWPDPPDDAGPAALVALVRAMLARDPAERPTAAAVADRLSSGRLGEPAPIRLGSGPCPTPASAKRWRGWAGTGPAAADRDPSASSAGRLDDPDGVPAPDATDAPEANEATGQSGEPAVDAAEPASASGSGWPSGTDGDADLDAVAGDDPRDDPGDRPTGAPPAAPARGARRGPLARLLLTVLAGLLVTVLVAQVSQWIGDPPAPVDPVATAGGPDRTDWIQVVTDLDLARSRALAQGDPALLDQVYLPGSAAGAADAATVAGLAAQGLRVVDGRHDVVSVEVLDDEPLPDPPAGEGAATADIRLAVVDTLTARPVLDGTGRQVGATTARGQERRILVLAATGAGYRISAVQPG